MILRAFDASRGDAARLGAFACSTGAPFETEVEEWIRTTAVVWLNDVPRARFQRRSVGFIEDADQLIAVVAWQDIARIDLEGIWLEVLAVGLTHQHGGNGSRTYDVTVDHLRTIDRDGDNLAGLVHVDNGRSQRLLAAKHWSAVATWGDDELWIGSL